MQCSDAIILGAKASVPARLYFLYDCRICPWLSLPLIGRHLLILTYVSKPSVSFEHHNLMARQLRLLVHPLQASENTLPLPVQEPRFTNPSRIPTRPTGKSASQQPARPHNTERNTHTFIRRPTEPTRCTRTKQPAPMGWQTNRPRERDHPTHWLGGCWRGWLSVCSGRSPIMRCLLSSHDTKGQTYNETAIQLQHHIDVCYHHTIQHLDLESDGSLPAVDRRGRSENTEHVTSEPNNRMGSGLEICPLEEPNEASQSR